MDIIRPILMQEKRCAIDIHVSAYISIPLRTQKPLGPWAIKLSLISELVAYIYRVLRYDFPCVCRIDLSTTVSTGCLYPKKSLETMRAVRVMIQ